MGKKKGYPPFKMRCGPSKCGHKTHATPKPPKPETEFPKKSKQKTDKEFDALLRRLGVNLPDSSGSPR